jgi:hypothetical protein
MISKGFEPNPFHEIIEWGPYKVPINLDDQYIAQRKQSSSRKSFSSAITAGFPRPVDTLQLQLPQFWSSHSIIKFWASYRVILQIHGGDLARVALFSFYGWFDPKWTSHVTFTVFVCPLPYKQSSMWSPFQKRLSAPTRTSVKWLRPMKQCT